MGRCRTADIAAAVAESGHEVMPGWAQTLARVTDAERFPALHAALASEAFEQDGRWTTSSSGASRGSSTAWPR